MGNQKNLFGDIFKTLNLINEFKEYLNEDGTFSKLTIDGRETIRLSSMSNDDVDNFFRNPVENIKINNNNYNDVDFEKNISSYYENENKILKNFLNNLFSSSRNLLSSFDETKIGDWKLKFENELKFLFSQVLMIEYLKAKDLLNYICESGNSFIVNCAKKEIYFNEKEKSYFDIDGQDFIEITKDNIEDKKQELDDILLYSLSNFNLFFNKNYINSEDLIKENIYYMLGNKYLKDVASLTESDCKNLLLDFEKSIKDFNILNVQLNNLRNISLEFKQFFEQSFDINQLIVNLKNIKGYHEDYYKKINNKLFSLMSKDDIYKTLLKANVFDLESVKEVSSVTTNSDLSSLENNLLYEGIKSNLIIENIILLGEDFYINKNSWDIKTILRHLEDFKNFEQETIQMIFKNINFDSFKLDNFTEKLVELYLRSSFNEFNLDKENKEENEAKKILVSKIEEIKFIMDYELVEKIENKLSILEGISVDEDITDFKSFNFKVNASKLINVLDFVKKLLNRNGVYETSRALWVYKDNYIHMTFYGDPEWKEFFNLNNLFKKCLQHIDSTFATDDYKEIIGKIISEEILSAKLKYDDSLRGNVEPIIRQRKKI